MDVAITIIAAILVVLGLTAVFYAAHSPRTLNEKTGIAALGFVAIVVALWIIGFWGAWAT